MSFDLIKSVREFSLLFSLLAKYFASRRGKLEWDGETFFFLAENFNKHAVHRLLLTNVKKENSRTKSDI